MSLDFLKKPEIGEIVQKEYSDAQLEKARDYISKYDGDDLYRDFLNDVTFTITENNREEYWKILGKISPLTPEQTTTALIKDIDQTLIGISDPLEKLSFLRDGSTTWSNEVKDHFAPTLEALDQFATADTMHTATLGYKTNLKQRALEFFKKEDMYLDPMVPKTQHLEDIMTIERNDKWEFMGIDDNGRIGINTPTGEWLSAINLNEGLSDHPELERSTPNKNEQYHVNMEGSDIMMSFISPVVEHSRKKLVEQRNESINDAFIGLQSGLIGREEAARVIVNKAQIKDEPFSEVIQKGFRSLALENEVATEDILKKGGKLLGEIVDLFSKRGTL